MDHLTFNHGRMVFSYETLEMTPSLPDEIELRIQIHQLAESGLIPRTFIDFDELQKLAEEGAPLWIHLSGSLSDDFWKSLKKFSDLSDQQIKDVRHPHKRGFVDEHREGIFWTLTRPFVGENLDALETINFFLCERLLITRQFSHDDAFKLAVHKLMSKGEELAAWSVDRLAASLVEDVVHSYLDVLAVGGSKLESLQNRIMKHPGKEELYLINRAQQTIWIFLKSVWPLESVIELLSRSRSQLVTPDGRNDFLHCQMLSSSILRTFETYREMSYDIMDVYVSGIGLRTNETTKVLTIIATLFLPPTLIAGIYGMNFQIPEVSVSFGYYICLFAMFLVSGGLLVWLKAKGYIEFL